MKLRAALTTIVLIGAGCASPSGNPPTEQVPTTATAAPTAGSTSTTARSSTSTTAPKGGVFLEAVDPATLAALPDHPPLWLAAEGARTEFVLDPAGHRVVGLVQHGRTVEVGTVDLTPWAWKPLAEAELPVGLQLGKVALSPGGTGLAWLTQPVQFGIDLGAHFHLSHYELGASRTTPLDAYPPSYEPIELRVLPSGMVAAVSLSVDRAPEVPLMPRVFVLDPTDGDVVIDLTLEEVEVERWWRQEGNDVEGHTDQPGVAWDLDQELLYLAHPGENQVTRVDLSDGTVRTAHIRPHLSVWERLAGWWVPSAQAKVVDGTLKEAVLSPDGTMLYVSGRREDTEQLENGSWTLETTPLGLRVIATDDLSEAAVLELPTDLAALSPEGAHLLLTEWSSEPDMAWRRSGLYLVDPAGLEVRAHLPENEESWDWVSINGFSADGRFAYLRVPPEWKVLDLEAGALVAERWLGHSLIIGSLEDRLLLARWQGN